MSREYSVPLPREQLVQQKQGLTRRGRGLERAAAIWVPPVLHP